MIIENFLSPRKRIAASVIVIIYFCVSAGATSSASSVLRSFIQKFILLILPRCQIHLFYSKSLIKSHKNTALVIYSISITRIFE